MTTFVELVTTDDTWLPHRSGAPPHGYLDEDAFAFRGVVLRRGELAMHIARLLPIELQASGVHCLSLDEAIVNEWAAGRLTPRTQDDLRALFAAFCHWDGGRLPTKAEWLYAVNGGDPKHTYPWGTDANIGAHASYNFNYSLPRALADTDVDRGAILPAPRNQSGAACLSIK